MHKQPTLGTLKNACPTVQFPRTWTIGQEREWVLTH
jgi:hypothetical protein